jgi:hypothetical protein
MNEILVSADTRDQGAISSRKQLQEVLKEHPAAPGSPGKKGKAGKKKARKQQ